MYEWHVAVTLLAHQGGWDEVLLVAAPIAAFAGLLWVANRRAARLGEDEHARADGGHEP